MGYDTDFVGQFNLGRRLEDKHANYLHKFSDTRRMKRDATIAESLPDPCRESVNLPIGIEGEHFVGGVGDFGQGRDASILNYNAPPKSQPGLWCQWVPSEDCQSIVWNGGEKFYSYVQWLDYLIAHFLAPWGYVLNGEVRWRGEDGAVGVITVKNNVVTSSGNEHTCWATEFYRNKQ